jgi:transcriptional regulator with XRE-family HTH domain
MIFSKQIQSILKEQGLNNRKASDLCGISEQQFGKYVNGKTTPSFDKGCDIINKLNWKVICFPDL